MKKFIVAVVAALALSLCVLPMSVFADDGGDAGVFAMGNESVAIGNSTFDPGDSGGGSIVPVANSITKVTAKKTIKYKTLKKKKVTFAIKATVKGKATKVIKKLSVTKKAKKYISVSKTGKVTVKKGLKKGKYTLKVKITAKATSVYKETSVTKKITIRVK